MEGDLIERAVDELVALAGDRRSWLVFCVTIAHAVAVAEALKARGIACEAMDGTMNKGARSSTIQRFRDGQLRCLTSVNVLSIGFNVPQVDVIALMRPTKSAGLYIQQVGRGFRRAEGKENCLILDFAKVVRMHGPVDAVTVHSPKKKGKGEGDGEALARAKICPNCATYAAPSAPSCMTCGFEWPVKDEAPKHDETADDSAGILSTEIVKPKMAPVVDWKFFRHEKPGSPDSVRVTYLAGLSEFREWLGFEHEGYPQRKAHQWWALHGGQAPFPRKVTDALLRVGELRRPTAIAVRKNGQYFDIVNRDFQEMETAS
jgi:DNA repair protein RadD